MPHIVCVFNISDKCPSPRTSARTFSPRHVITQKHVAQLCGLHDGRCMLVRTDFEVPTSFLEKDKIMHNKNTKVKHFMFFILQ